MSSNPLVQFMLECSQNSPWLFATLVIVIMVSEGLFLGLITEWIFRLLGFRIRPPGHRTSPR